MREYIGGVPKDVFGNASGQFFTETGLYSKRPLKCFVNTTQVLISDTVVQRQGCIHFGVSALKEEDAMSFSILTRGWNEDRNQHHLDFFARQLMQAIIHFFAGSPNGLNSIVGHWNPDIQGISSTNYESLYHYLQVFKNLQPKLSADERWREAAKKTWTGQLATDNGFYSVDILNKDPRHITVRFSR